MKQLRIEDAKQIAKKCNKKMVIIFHVDDKNLGYTSYGIDKIYCQKARKLGDIAYNEIYNYLINRGK